jgi:4-carboxymuconolactone decarboxylase
VWRPQPEKSGGTHAIHRRQDAALSTAGRKPLGEQIVKVSSVGIGGPYEPLLSSPVLGQRLFDLFDYLRWKTSVETRLNEFAILIIGRQWRSQVEWFTLAPIAIKPDCRPNKRQQPLA